MNINLLQTFINDLQKNGHTKVRFKTTDGQLLDVADFDDTIIVLGTQKDMLLPSPPAGQQWHRDDWAVVGLPPGYRPLLLNEHDQDGDLVYSVSLGSYYAASEYKNWCILRGCNGATVDYSPHCCTKRPLPGSEVDPYADAKAAYADAKAAYAAGQLQIRCAAGEDEWQDWRFGSPSYMAPPEDYRWKPKAETPTPKPLTPKPLSMENFPTSCELRHVMWKKDEFVHVIGRSAKQVWWTGLNGYHKSATYAELFNEGYQIHIHGDMCGGERVWRNCSDEELGYDANDLDLD